ncbi:MAG: S8 family serine peptidase [Clostridiaceae bacterium]
MRKIITVILAGMLFISFCLPNPVMASSSEANAPAAYDGYIVKLKNDMPPKMTLFGGNARRIGKGMYKTGSLKEARSIANPEYIEYIEPNYYLTLFEFPDIDPNDAYYGYNKSNLDNINASAAWKNGMYGAGTKVAVIDSGLVAAHEDINSSNVGSGYNFTAAGDPADTADQSGHGSFVSGIIAAQVNNAAGISGLADEVGLIPVKCFAPERGTTVAMIINAINYAMEQKCDVINMSFGTDYYSESLEAAVNQAAEAGIILVAAAGNYGTAPVAGYEADNFIYPAAFANVIGVGSVNSLKIVSDFSQKNNSVFVTAPGENLASLWFTNQNAYRLGWSGTSFSTPFVTAMAALAKSADGDIATDTFKTLLINSSEDLGDYGRDIFYGYGLVNVARFIDALKTDYTIGFELNGGAFSTDTAVPAKYNVKSDNIALPVPVKTGFDFAGWYDNAELSGNPTTVIPAGSAGNRTYCAKWRDASGTNITAVSVSGYAGTRAEGFNLFTVEIPAGMIPATTPEAVSVTTEDPEAAAGIPATTDSGLTWSVTVTARDTVTARTFAIRVSNSSNHAPAVLSGQEYHSTGENAAIPASRDGLAEACPYMVNVSGWFTDEDAGDKDSLTYTAYAANIQGEAVMAGSTLTFTPAAADAGKTVFVKVRANDGQFDSGGVIIAISVGALPVSNSAIFPVSAAYDKYSKSENHKDITIEMLLYGNTLTAIRNGETLLTGNDYTIADGPITQSGWAVIEAESYVTINGLFLDKLTSAENTLTVEFSAGQNALLEVLVSDTAPLYTVTFNVDGTQYAITENIREGNNAALPAQPLKTGYTFGGWYTGTDGSGTAFTSSTKVNSSMTVYAKWIINSGNNTNPGGGGFTGGGPVGVFPAGGLPLPVLFNITTEAGGGGSITDSLSVSSGMNASVTIKPDMGYSVSAVLIDGVSIGLSVLVDNSDGTYSLKLDKISSNHTVKVEFTSAPPVPARKTAPVFELFSDVSRNGWYTEAVQLVYDLGLFNGTGDSSFSPEEHMTRGMFVSVLGRLSGINADKSGSQAFKDVKAGEWFAPFAAWACENGIVSGYGNGLFGPYDDINREQLTLIMYRYAIYMKYDVSADRESPGRSGGSGDTGDIGGSDSLSVFSDAGNISGWARDAADWAVGVGLISGRPGNIFDPQGVATRAEVAVIIQRFIKIITRQ